MKRLLACGLILLAGCSYYNGMYRVDNLAGRARRAEHEGRTFEAASLWGQVSVKAESALVHHPNSGWADRARLLRGTALARLRDCRSALAPLQLAVASPDTRVAEEATAVLGACHATLGDPVAAAAAFARLTGSRDAARRDQALFYHGQALRLGGDYAAALAELEQSRLPRARGERAAALAGLGRLEEARHMADSLIAERDSLVPWDSLFAALARHSQPEATSLLDALVRQDSFPLALRGRLLLADARRRVAFDPAAAAARFAQIEQLGPRQPFGAEARYYAAISRLAAMDSLPQLATEIEQASDENLASSTFAARTTLLEGFARRVLLIADSTLPGSADGDLRLFVAAELLRDSLLAPRLAAGQFGRVADEWPDSPFAPKAQLARIALDSTVADSLREILGARYGDNPYVMQALGSEAPAMAQLEDSLRRFAQSYRPEGRRPAAPAAAPGNRPRPPARPTPTPQPATPREPVDQ